MKHCIVKGCGNSSDRGAFEGDLCLPCHKMLTTGEIGFTDSFLSKFSSQNRKIVQIISHREYLTALCDDGSVWVEHPETRYEKRLQVDINGNHFEEVPVTTTRWVPYKIRF